MVIFHFVFSKRLPENPKKSHQIPLNHHKSHEIPVVYQKAPHSPPLAPLPAAAPCVLLATRRRVPVPSQAGAASPFLTTCRDVVKQPVFGVEKHWENNKSWRKPGRKPHHNLDGNGMVIWLDLYYVRMISESKDVTR